MASPSKYRGAVCNRLLELGYEMVDIADIVTVHASFIDIMRRDNVSVIKCADLVEYNVAILAS